MSAGNKGPEIGRSWGQGFSMFVSSSIYSRPHPTPNKIGAYVENAPAPYRPPIYNLEVTKNRRKSDKVLFFVTFSPILAYFGVCSVFGRVVLNAYGIRAGVCMP